MPVAFSPKHAVVMVEFCSDVRLQLLRLEESSFNGKTARFRSYIEELNDSMLSRWDMIGAPWPDDTFDANKVRLGKYWGSTEDVRMFRRGGVESVLLPVSAKRNPGRRNLREP